MKKNPERRRRSTFLAKNDYNFRRSLILAREERGLSQKDVGDKLGISQQAVAKFESMEADPKLSTIRQYANAVQALYIHTVVLDTGQFTLEDDLLATYRLFYSSVSEDDRETYLVSPPTRASFAIAA
ncbi:MAG: helix-turn-helix transcriptional regulator [Microbacteriaceae bacterium]